MKTDIFRPCLFFLFPFITFSQAQTKLPYKNPGLSLEERTADLLTRMTLEEKIGEMTQMCASSITLDGSKKLDLNIDKIREVIKAYHIGSFLSGTGKAERWADFITEIQKIAVNETRLGIPVIFAMDNVHGSDYVDEATFLPHNLNIGCTFNPEIAASGALVTNKESGPLGHVWNFAPVLDIGKNPYWPRLYETFGEDPLVCGIMGSAFIRATQNCPAIAPYRVAACAKHFIGYSDPKSGWDRTPSEIPDQVLYEYFVPSFKMAFDAGVKTLMVNSGELNGEPVHGSKKILTGLLRKKLGFNGLIVTDIKDIMKIVEMHGGAADEKEATLMAIDAGIDMYMACNSYYFCDYMKAFVKSGKISEERINESVRRILKLKFELGLFENPYPTKKRLKEVGSQDHFSVALQAARESIVLLKNANNLLPLSANTKKILLAGFAANNKRNITGPWTLEWMGAEEARQPARMNTLYQAMKNQFPSTEITLLDSAHVPSHPDYRKMYELALQSDVVVLTAGEKPYSEFKGNTNDLSLAENELAMIKAAQKAGKPVVLVMIEGRPRVISSVTAELSAVLFAGIPGIAGTDAIAEILSGKTNPSGKLCFSYPSAVGHTVPYYHKKSEKYTAEFGFGHGLSFTNYGYNHLQISDTVLTSPFQKLTLSVEIGNTGNIPGKESVLWFVQDEVGKITRPVRQLKHFEKQIIAPGETRKFLLELVPAKDLSYPDEEGNPVLENGWFTVSTGNLTKRFRLEIR